MSYLFIALLSLLFSVGIFFTRERFALWIKYAFLFIGAVGVACGSLGFALEYYRPTLVYSTRAYMDHLLDWRLIHRSADELRQLFARSNFGAHDVCVTRDATGVQLFAACAR